MTVTRNLIITLLPDGNVPTFTETIPPDRAGANFAIDSCVPVTIKFFTDGFVTM